MVCCSRTEQVILALWCIVFPIIMQSQRTSFNLKGTNISLPNRYKIKLQPYKAKSQKPDSNSDVPTDKTLPTIIDSKQSLLLRRLLQLPQVYVCMSQEISSHINSEQSYSSHAKAESLTSTTAPQTQSVVSISNSQLFERKQPKLSLLRKNRQHHSTTKTKRCTCGECEGCMKDFSYFLQLFSDDRGVPEISAKSWCVWKRKNGRHVYYYGRRIHKVREIASLTKMVTAITALHFLNTHQLNPQLVTYRIRKTSTLIGGTSAQLLQGQICTLLQLLYGMMLPSGNDAAVALSEAIGLLSFLNSKNRSVNPQADGWYEPYANKNYAHLFIGLMNERCQKMGTLETKLVNSHGNDAYDQFKNVSTCNEVAKIASEFMNCGLLREIVRTQKYGRYENTNKLLEDGFDGIKTGITDTAGPCLAASYKDYIIVVLNSKSMSERWIEVKKLVKWIIRKC